MQWFVKNSSNLNKPYIYSLNINLFQPSLKFLLSIDVPFVKIGSGDSEDVLLLQEASKSGKPLVISTGNFTMILCYLQIHIINYLTKVINYRHVKLGISALCLPDGKKIS